MLELYWQVLSHELCDGCSLVGNKRTIWDIGTWGTDTATPKDSCDPRYLGANMLTCSYWNETLNMQRNHTRGKWKCLESGHCIMTCHLNRHLSEKCEWSPFCHGLCELYKKLHRIHGGNKPFKSQDMSNWVISIGLNKRICHTSCIQEMRHSELQSVERNHSIGLDAFK